MSGNLLRLMITRITRHVAAGLLVVAVAAVLGSSCWGDATTRTPSESGLAATASLSEGLPHEAVIFHGDAAFSGVEEDETDPKAFGLGDRTRAAGHPTAWLPQQPPRRRVTSGCRRYHLRI